jgi:hypothetical protein
MCFESLQLIRPETLNVVDPVAKLSKRLPAEL